MTIDRIGPKMIGHVPQLAAFTHHQEGGMEEEGAWFETLRAKESRKKSANSLARSCKLVDQSCSS